MSPQRKPRTADGTAKEALDRVVEGKTPTRRALAFLLADNEPPSPNIAQSRPNPSPDPAQSEPSPKVARSQPRPGPIAPERNYNKRANSLEHSALPSGLFPGASKKIYDALYVRTRGAIQPTRTVQAKHRELLAWSGIKDIKTVKTHLSKLREQGLVAWHTLKGEHEGSFYEVFLPEEVSPDLAQTEANPSPILKTDSDLAQKTDWVGLPKSVDVKDLTDDSKTSFKTKGQNTDDEAARRFVFLMQNAELELTGKNSSFSDAWEELASVLITELRIAAGRTAISSVPAFLAEHLRRRLWKKDKRQLDAEGVGNRPVPASQGQQAQKAAIPEGATCPDCFNTGMWYPEGFEKGVARCGHDKLTKEG